MMVINTSGQESKYIKISNQETTVAVDIEYGGRIMEYSYQGNNVIFVQKNGDRRVNGPDGGRCDFGPEKIVPPRPETWEGSWELAEKKEYYIKIKSGVAKEAGVYLIREFMLHETTSHLEFTQHIVNVSESPKRYCHWSRTFAEPNGICLAPVNPNSRFHLSLRVNYPNDFDRAMGAREGRSNLGGDIMIHGSKVSIGCLAMGDLAAEDLFILAAETGVDNVYVILSPIDFRVRDFEGDFSQMPGWIPKLYEQIKAELIKYPKGEDTK